MATITSQTPGRRSSRAGGPTRAGRHEVDERPRPDVVSETLAAFREGRAKRFARSTRPMDAARAMLDRLRSR